MKILNWLTLFVATIALSLAIYGYTSRTKTVYVRNGDVLQKYIGLKEVNAVYEKKIAYNQGQLDTIVKEYRGKVTEFESLKSQFSKKQQQDKEYQLREEAQRIRNFESSSKEDLTQEHEQLLTGVLNQINAFAEIYAKEKGYDLVIGTTNSGNLMYGNKEMDVTEDFIERLNQYYKKGK